MTVTKGPAVLDALLALAGSSMGSDIEVVDTYVLQPERASVLTIGFSDPHDANGAPAVSSRQEPLEGMGTQRREQLTFGCRLTAPVDEPKAARDYLLFHLGALDAALRASNNLGRLVQSVYLGPDFELRMFDGPSGDELRYDFLISADCYI